MKNTTRKLIKTFRANKKSTAKWWSTRGSYASRDHAADRSLTAYQLRKARKKYGNRAVRNEILK